MKKSLVALSIIFAFLLCCVSCKNGNDDDSVNIRDLDGLWLIASSATSGIYIKDGKYYFTDKANNGIFYYDNSIWVDLRKTADKIEYGFLWTDGRFEVWGEFKLVDYVTLIDTYYKSNFVYAYMKSNATVLPK